MSHQQPACAAVKSHKVTPDRSMCTAAAAGRTLAAAVAGAARREVAVAHLDVVGEADDVLDAAAGGENTASYTSHTLWQQGHTMSQPQQMKTVLPVHR